MIHSFFLSIPYIHERYLVDGGSSSTCRYYPDLSHCVSSLDIKAVAKNVRLFCGDVVAAAINTIIIIIITNCYYCCCWCRCISNLESQTMGFVNRKKVCCMLNINITEICKSLTKQFMRFFRLLHLSDNGLSIP